MTGCYFASARDITDRLLANDALRKSTIRLQRLYESGTVGIVYWDRNGRIAEANDRFLEMVGLYA